MELHKDIATFLYWVEEKPSIFLPQAWRDLPGLEEEIAKLANNESSIAEAIKNWCKQRGLGEALRDTSRGDIRPRKPNPTTKPPIGNITQILRDSILTAYNQQQNLSLENSAGTNNEPN